jgi:hypothetical protein
VGIFATRIVRLQNSAARLDRGEQSVSDMTGCDGRGEITDDFAPNVLGHARMGVVVSNDLDVVLAERYEKKDTFAISLTTREVHVKFPMRELPRMSMLHVLWYQP